MPRWAASMPSVKLASAWWQTFLGFERGSLGETSTLACLIGAAFLIYTRIASWRIIAGVMLGMMVTSTLFNIIGSDSDAMFVGSLVLASDPGWFCFRY
jgi:Na+-transporting NADH:ubiquinone oxidoreductase subunit NqrB